MMGTTAQSITLTYTVRPSDQWALMDVCSIPTWPAYHVDIFFDLSIFQQGCVDTLLLGAQKRAPLWVLSSSLNISGLHI